jgi:hypothetical protein
VLEEGESLVPVAIAVAIITVVIAIVPPIVAIIAVITFERLATLFAPVIGLASVIAALSVIITPAFVGETVFRSDEAPLTVIAVSGLRAGSARKEKKPTQRRSSERCLAKQRLP